MRQRVFHFRLGSGSRRGLPGPLMLIMGALVIAGVVTLIVFVGAIVLSVGLLAAAGAALYFGVRKLLGKAESLKLSKDPQINTPGISKQPPTTVREIEVEVIPDNRT